MISKNQLECGISSYLDNEFLNRLNVDQWKKFVIGTSLSVVIKRMDKLIDSLKVNPVVSAMGIVDADSNIDIDVLIEQAKLHIPPEGLKIDIPMVGELILHVSDLDEMWRYMR